MWEQWKRLASGYILQVEPKGFAERGVREESSKTLRGSGWSTREDGVATAGRGQCWCPGSGGKSRNWVWGQCFMSSRHLSADAG